MKRRERERERRASRWNNWLGLEGENRSQRLEPLTEKLSTKKSRFIGFYRPSWSKRKGGPGREEHDKGGINRGKEKGRRGTSEALEANERPKSLLLKKVQSPAVATVLGKAYRSVHSASGTAGTTIVEP